MAQQAAELTLVITNPTETGGGASIEHSFGPRGGSIGTAASDSWRLSPHRTGAVAGHAEVRYLDGGFCLIDRSGRTYINSSSQSVGRGRRARLSHGDTVTIGRYQIRAELSGVPAAVGEMEDDVREHHSLVDAPESGLRHAANEQEQPEGREPLEGLQSAAGESVSSDPLAHWQQKPARPDEEAPELLASDRAWFARSAEVTDEYRETQDVAMGLLVTPQRDNKERQGMSESTRSPQEVSRQHISGAPLLRGLDADIDFADSDQMRLFLEDAGQTLKATVEGLLALHQGEDSRHQALRTRLQPIEDNPLRLANDYPDTIQTLFAAKRSPVHLSAPAAVRESLESLNHHQQATREAIREGLEAILHAFSPGALLRRFHGYRRGLQDNEDEGRWAWEMYQHYYRELKSSRQKGFERLFREVFDQAYDQHLRQLQREKL
ncbi:MAG: type VI secretion system-associated FHA domain protein TagH [Marinobacter sp.]|uniref:type VI secretion system-associated FHA domain protein TagH n=1 Tax=Marinobacter sp. TaxID=50741 RepID=UPI00396EDD0C